MKNFKGALGGAVGLGLILVSACERTQTPAPTVSYYRTHPQERRDQVRACADSPAAAREDAACINAFAAEGQESTGSLRDLPPLNLPRPGEKGTPSR